MWLGLPPYRKGTPIIGKRGSGFGNLHVWSCQCFEGGLKLRGQRCYHQTSYMLTSSIQLLQIMRDKLAGQSKAVDFVKLLPLELTQMIMRYLDFRTIV